MNDSNRTDSCFSDRSDMIECAGIEFIWKIDCLTHVEVDMIVESKGRVMLLEVHSLTSSLVAVWSN